MSLKPLGCSRGLRVLDASYTMVRNVSSLQYCTQLESLNLCSTDVRDVRPLLKCTLLLCLDLFKTKIGRGDDEEGAGDVDGDGDGDYDHGYGAEDVDGVGDDDNNGHSDGDNGDGSDENGVGHDHEATIGGLGNIGDGVNDGDGDVDGVVSLPVLDLRELNLGETDVCSVPQLGDGAFLERVLFMSTLIRSIESLRPHSNLQYLDISFTHISDISPIEVNHTPHRRFRHPYLHSIPIRTIPIVIPSPSHPHPISIPIPISIVRTIVVMLLFARVEHLRHRGFESGCFTWVSRFDTTGRIQYSYSRFVAFAIMFKFVLS